MATRTLSRRSARNEEPEDQDDDRSPLDDEDDEPPRRGRARGRSRSEDTDDEPPRRSRRSSSRDEDDEDEEPRRRSRSSRRSRDDDEDDEPRSSRRGGRDSGEKRPRASNTGKGWKSFKEKREETSDYVKNYKLPEGDAGLIKILDEEPFSVYSQHWLDELKGKKSFVCIGDDCPLCDVGDKPRVYALFNVLDLTDPDSPVVRPWQVSTVVADVLENYANDKKTSPLNRDDLYWSVLKTGGGKKGRVQTNLNPVKARDLLDDWDIEPFTEEELDEFVLLTEEDVLQYSSRKALQEIADDLD